MVIPDFVLHRSKRIQIQVEALAVVKHIVASGTDQLALRGLDLGVFLGEAIGLLGDAKPSTGEVRYLRENLRGVSAQAKVSLLEHVSPV